MNRKLCALAFSLYMFTLPTYAANWVSVTVSSIGDEFFVDKSSLQRDGDSVTFWAKDNYGERTTQGALSAKVQETVNCRRREKIMRYYINYDDKDNRGRVIVSGNPEDKWRPIPPGTVAWDVMQFVCRK